MKTKSITLQEMAELFRSDERLVAVGRYLGGEEPGGDIHGMSSLLEYIRESPDRTVQSGWMAHELELKGGNPDEGVFGERFIVRLVPAALVAAGWTPPEGLTVDGERSPGGPVTAEDRFSAVMDAICRVLKREVCGSARDQFDDHQEADNASVVAERDEVVDRGELIKAIVARRRESKAMNLIAGMVDRGVLTRKTLLAWAALTDMAAELVGGVDCEDWESKAKALEALARSLICDHTEIDAIVGGEREG